MNIDVREYLRTNPISVHNLTLSQDGKDCILIFLPVQANKTAPYQVWTQDETFDRLYQDIFDALLDENLELACTISGGKVIWPPNIHLSTKQFTDYARRTVYEEFKNAVNNILDTMQDNLDRILTKLTNEALLNYKGAVDIQAKVVSDMYAAFSYSLGMLWCQQPGSSNPTGSDEITLDVQPAHSHANTKAETMTASFTNLRGGCELIGNFKIGDRNMVSSDVNYNIPVGTPLEVIVGPAPSPLTYPMYGQNVLDWRTSKRAHNNLPPACNVLVRYSTTDVPPPSDPLGGPGVDVGSIHPIPVNPGVEPDIPEPDEPSPPGSAAECQYESNVVPGLSDFVEADVTKHDYLMRMSLDGSTEVKLMKQSLQMFLDIFSDIGNRHMSKDGLTMEELLKPLLDRELVPIGEIMSWQAEVLQRLEDIRGAINLVKERVAAIQPKNYVGRVIMSTKDDTEAKVVKNYGGRKWRRIVNFPKGVARGATGQNAVGIKRGEAYVCLRESQVPLHQHPIELASVETTGTANNWLGKERGGQVTKIVTGYDAGSLAGGTKLDNRTLNYQLSPMEYNKDATYPVPHNNMPPFKEVYIWECMAI